jgi:hypothetical protein
VANRKLHFRGTWAATAFIYPRQASLNLENNNNPQQTQQNQPSTKPIRDKSNPQQIQSTTNLIPAKANSDQS